jgi:NADH-quinone oxidoreductase subunit E
MPFALSADRERQLDTIVTRYPTKMAACLAALHLCQEQNGYVSDDAMLYVAHRLDVPPAHVKGVVTFYTLFNQKPVGKHQVWVCRTLPCALRGADDLVKHCEKRLGIHAGETTTDGTVTLRTAECLASCGTAPVMQVDKEYFENLTFEKVDELLDRLRRS